jgi:predicted TIM-barrel fold metal-dependent hydrolase
MPKIIDLRVRPPIGSFLDLHIYARGAEKSVVHKSHPPSASFTQRSMKLLLEEMDAAQVIGVIMGRQGAKKYGHVSNDEIAAIVRDNPGRFIPFAGVQLADPARAVDEVERAIKELGFVGVNLEPGFDERPVRADDRSLYPIYEKCKELKVPVSISMSVRIGPDLTYADPLAIQHVCTDFPDVKFISSHACWPYVQEIIGVAWVCTNLYVSPDFYMAIEHMPFAGEFVNAANLFLDDRLLFGSAYPVRAIDECISTFNKLPFKSQAIKNRILYDNAAALFGLE